MKKSQKRKEAAASKPKGRREAEGFKIDCARLMLNRGVRSVGELSKELGVGEKSLYRWQAQYRATLEKPESELAAELERLRRENAQLREERDILKKATAFFVRAAR
jgi:transposase